MLSGLRMVMGWFRPMRGFLRVGGWKMIRFRSSTWLMSGRRLRLLIVRGVVIGIPGFSR